MPYFFTSESVSEGHPDKISDQISDAILDEFLTQDPDSKVACETLCTTGLVVVSGEVKSHAYVDVQKIVREVIKKIGYTKSEYKFDADSCGVITTLHEQSPDINQGVNQKKIADQGAGDQGMMFGYATNETENYMPLALDISHKILKVLADIRKTGKYMTYLRPDSKSQVTIEYGDDDKPAKIDTIVVSTQHDEFVMAKTKSASEKTKAQKAMQKKISDDIKKYVIPAVKKQYTKKVQALFTNNIKYYINPTGNFVIGGPHGDTGLTGRKIIVDTYGGKGAHGGGAFSGKDSSKVDRSAAYATRHIAKNCVAAGLADRMLVQVAYAIGVSKPLGLYVQTYGTSKVELSDGEIAKKLEKIFDLRPGAIVKNFGLKNPIFKDTAAYGHMGRKPITMKAKIKGVPKSFKSFTWEELDKVKQIKSTFKL